MSLRIKSEIEHQLAKTIKIVRSYRGAEYYEKLDNENQLMDPMWISTELLYCYSVYNARYFRTDDVYKRRNRIARL